jgi:hypothetical protein
MRPALDYLVIQFVDAVSLVKMIEMGRTVDLIVDRYAMEQIGRLVVVDAFLGNKDRLMPRPAGFRNGNLNLGNILYNPEGGIVAIDNAFFPVRNAALTSHNIDLMSRIGDADTRTAVVDSLLEYFQLAHQNANRARRGVSTWILDHDSVVKAKENINRGILSALHEIGVRAAAKEHSLGEKQSAIFPDLPHDYWRIDELAAYAMLRFQNIQTTGQPAVTHRDAIRRVTETVGSNSHTPAYVGAPGPYSSSMRRSVAASTPSVGYRPASHGSSGTPVFPASGVAPVVPGSPPGQVSGYAGPTGAGYQASPAWSPGSYQTPPSGGQGRGQGVSPYVSSDVPSVHGARSSSGRVDYPASPYSSRQSPYRRLGSARQLDPVEERLLPGSSIYVDLVTPGSREYEARYGRRGDRELVEVTIGQGKGKGRASYETYTLTRSLPADRSSAPWLSYTVSGSEAGARILVDGVRLPAEGWYRHGPLFLHEPVENGQLGWVLFGDTGWVGRVANTDTFFDAAKRGRDKGEEWSIPDELAESLDLATARRYRVTAWSDGLFLSEEGADGAVHLPWQDVVRDAADRPNLHTPAAAPVDVNDQSVVVRGERPDVDRQPVGAALDQEVADRTSVPAADLQSVPAGIAQALGGRRAQDPAAQVLLSEIATAVAVDPASSATFGNALTALDMYGVVDTYLGKQADPALVGGALFDVLEHTATDPADPVKVAAEVAEAVDVLENHGVIDRALSAPGDRAERRWELSGRLRTTLGFIRRGNAAAAIRQAREAMHGVQ